MKRTSLRTRLLWLMICLTTLPVVTLSVIATFNTQKSVEKEVINANYSRMIWANQYLSEIIDQINTLYTSIQINESIMHQVDPNIDKSILSSAMLRNVLTPIFYSYSQKIDHLALYNHSKQELFTVSFVDSGTARPFNVTNSLWERTTKEPPVNMYFKQTPTGISAYHSINRFPDQYYFGGIAVAINKEVWSDILQILKSEAESDVFLMNDEGEILFSSTAAITSPEIINQINVDDFPAIGVDFLKTKEYFFFKERVADGQLSVVKVIPVKLVKESALPTIKAGILTGSIFVFLSIFLSIVVSLRITRPIIGLARSMLKTNVLQFETRLVQSFDEIGLLQHGYNSMMTKIKELIEHEYQHEIEIKNAQLLALQAQINPHFLNNTLNLIGGMALAKDSVEIYTISRVIGDMFRYSINSSDMIVTVQEEVTHMRNYLFIQEQRFSEKCTIVFKLDPAIDQSKIPKFILQPLVENSFEHGLQPKRGHWELEIRIRKIGKRMIVIIKDNGVGMTKERLTELRLHLKGEAKSKAGSKPTSEANHIGIGINNVHTRSRLHFGYGYGVRMYSNEYGTIIVLVLPAND